MLKINDVVRIKSEGISGTIVDISTINGKTNYVVESNIADVTGGYGGKWKLFDCSESELEKTA